ncbi:hypothetical protein KV097_05415 [Mumia sp. zg.B17]|uniref:DUF6339 family protein n=1 Tax=Mumia sp. zg.B17 TaxID=2855446 RepID=UPI001C6F570F|nr:DUF6339 family protein [Mumia sp. zg.B17]MBW9205377.1 hypothetical protein [Mumia sp. zg.B17]
MKKLRELVGVTELPVSFLETAAGFDPSDYVTEFPDRAIDVEPLINVIDEGMRRFTERSEESDAWLAPRMHHVLRLTRREAARRGVWAWLAVVAAPQYVHWRFPGDSGATAVDRFLGREDKNAVGRLWWGAELMRDGGDYGPVAVGFSMQDVPNTWMRLDAFHNRALVQASLEKLRLYNGGKMATSDQVNAVAKAVNTAARTILIDAVTIDVPLDSAATEAWLEGSDGIDETTIYDVVPDGPLEDAVSEACVTEFTRLLDEVVAEMPANQPRVGAGPHLDVP